MMIPKVLSLALFLLCSTSTVASIVELETMVMQLRSEVDTQNNELLDKVLSVTTQYMDDYFGAYYENTAEPRDYFSHTSLTVYSFGIHGVTGSFITTLEIDGTLFFNSDPAPSRSFINILLTNAFQDVNLDLFIETILSADNEFLTALNHIIIEINDNTVTKEDTIASEEETAESEWSRGKEIVVNAVVGFFGALLIIGVFFCIYRCYSCKNKRQVQDNVEPVHLKSIEIPSTVNNQVQRGSRRSGSRQVEAKVEPVKLKSIEIPTTKLKSIEIPTTVNQVQRGSRRSESRSVNRSRSRSVKKKSESRSVKKKNADVNFKARSRSPPSHNHSFTSQDSSNYKPTLMSMSKGVGTSTMSKKSFSVGSMSAMGNIDMPSIDIESSWNNF